MSDFIKRLNTEKSDLLIKIDKLSNFTKTASFCNIEDEQQELLLIQLKNMQAYYSVLDMRLRLLEKK